MQIARFDRIATLGFFHPLAQQMAKFEEGRVPILMYHSISAEEEGHVHPYYRLCTPPWRFAEQIDFLRQNNFSVVSLSDLMDRLRTGGTVVDNCVVLTFDDGYADFYSQAVPVLSVHGFTATVFLATEYVGEAPRAFKGKPCLTWTQVRELRDAGFSFGSHTVNHPQLRFLSDADLEFELEASKAAIEDKLGCAVHSFSYPYAFPEEDVRFVAKIRALLGKHGYQCGVSTIIGTVSAEGDRFFLKRLPVNGGDDLRLFRAKLDGGYNWFRLLQWVHKRCGFAGRAYPTDHNGNRAVRRG